MENVIKEVIEVPEAVPSPVSIPEPEGGFPWCGVGIVVVVVAAAIVGRKYCCKK
jgi:hypothetical protein